MKKISFNIGDIVRVEGDPASKYYGQVGMVYKIREDGWVGVDMRDGTYIERFEEDLQLLPPEEYVKSNDVRVSEKSKIVLYEDFVERFGLPRVGEKVIWSIKDNKVYKIVGMYDDKVYLERLGNLEDLIKEESYEKIAVEKVFDVTETIYTADGKVEKNFFQGMTLEEIKNTWWAISESDVQRIDSLEIGQKIDVNLGLYGDYLTVERIE